MAVKVNKLQKEYLEDRLNKIKRERLEQAEIQYPTSLSAKEILYKIDNGEIKLKQNLLALYEQDEISFNRYTDAITLFDLSKYEDEFKKNRAIIDCLRQRLDKKIIELMDRYMLGGEDLTKALDELREV